MNRHLIRPSQFLFLLPLIGLLLTANSALARIPFLGVEIGTRVVPDTHQVQYFAEAGLENVGQPVSIHWQDGDVDPDGFISKFTLFDSLPQLQSSLLSLTIFQVSMSGTTPNVVYAYPSGATLSAGQIAAAQGVLTDGQSGVVVTATYNHSLQFFPTLMTSFLGSVLTPSFTAVQLKG